MAEIQKLKFENDQKVPEYALSRGIDVKFTGTEDQCYRMLQRSQSQSCDWAMKYEGWIIEPTGNMIDDPIIYVEVVKVECQRLTFKYRGGTYKVHTNAVLSPHPCIGDKGDTVRVDSAYAYLP